MDAKEELLAGLRSGDERAFDNIFHSFYASLCYFACRLISDPAVANELVQDALLLVWQKRDGFYSFDSLKAFVYISTRNACYNHLKKVKVNALRQQAIANSNEQDDDTVLHQIIETEVFRELYAAIDTLPEQCNKVMKMIVDGSKPKEIAEELGITISTVNNQKMRGISLLKKRLSNEGLATLVILVLSAAVTFHIS